MPLATAFRCQDYVDNGSPVYCGTLGLGIDPRLAARVRESDLLLVIGARLDEPTTGGYSMIEAPRPRQPLIHVHADPDELGRVFEPALGICAGSAEFVAAAQALPSARRRALRRLDRRRGGRRARVPDARRGRRRGRSGPRGLGPVRRARAGGDHHQRRRQLHAVGPSLLALSPVRRPARAGQRLDGLRTAGRDRREAGRARTPGRLVQRRRLLHDGLPGAGDRRAPPGQRRVRRDRQRQLRHDPHAPGAALPRPAGRDRARPTRTSSRSPGRSDCRPAR